METELIESRDVAEGTKMFTFKKPAGFNFMAGQSIDLTLVNPSQTDAEGNTRAFSIVKAPDEEHLAIATRLRDTAFKRELKSLPIGAKLSFEGPFGDFTLHENAQRPAVILAGGIGITPFHSIIADATRRKLPHKIVLLYSNRRPEDAPFLDDLHGFARDNANFTFVPTMTEIDKSAQVWQGETGYIDADKVRKYVPQGSMPVYYLAGPAAMVKAMRELLNSMGVSRDDIRTEEFTGY